MHTQTIGSRPNGKPLYQEDEVVNHLRNLRKHDLYIPKDRKEVQVLIGSSARNDVGVRTRGKLDFLGKYCGYRIFSTKKFQK